MIPSSYAISGLLIRKVRTRENCPSSNAVSRLTKSSVTLRTNQPN
ncbi:hypothetical protein UUU_00260 [Klebsiella pneumoniae subsp. pneumoniae DSM 30104 = JCM 1662 = NBRC 14940]|nr:hypothetical protein UUU_00260 [Klebsiella pneumoniae subsp. pneumoniae DSM 30104 = JCM 1662 = NBRC 14940]